MGIWPVVCGFLTLCRKDFTTQVQVILRVRLLELGVVKQRSNLGWKKQQESLGGALLWPTRNVTGKK